MQLWEIKNSASSLNLNLTSTSSKNISQGNSSVASAYAAILAEKLANVREDLQKMNAVQEQLDEVRDLQEKITGQVKIDEDSGNANRSSSGGNENSQEASETIKRFMPDGSIMITTYKDGDVVQQFKQRPHMIPTPDYSVPPDPFGNAPIKMEAKQGVDLLSLLM